MQRADDRLCCSTLGVASPRSLQGAYLKADNLPSSHFSQRLPLGMS
jgi:hypothetical protein